MSAELRERVADMRAWALARIRQCRVEEIKFSRPGKRYGGQGPAPGATDVPIRAQSERAALESVLRQLGAECRHDFGWMPDRLSDFDGAIVRCNVCGIPSPDGETP